MDSYGDVHASRDWVKDTGTGLFVRASLWLDRELFTFRQKLRALIRCYLVRELVTLCRIAGEALQKNLNQSLTRVGHLYFRVACDALGSRVEEHLIGELSDTDLVLNAQSIARTT